MKKFWIRKGFMIAGFVITAMLLFSLLVMWLWNAILPAVIGVRSISFLQALGLLILSKILFGGFHGGWRRGRGPEWRQRMKEKWEKMSPEERERFKAEWKNRCGSRWGRGSGEDSTRSGTVAGEQPGY